MRVAFRTDASSVIGSGHFMRCLTLADTLSDDGAEICFVARFIPEHLGRLLAARGYQLARLQTPEGATPDSGLEHSDWLGVSRLQDARDTLQALGDAEWDWLVVDHYGIDAGWESVLREKCRRILVIDDLANRPHDCDALIDQNLHPDTQYRYSELVPESCRLFLGPQYAFLREEFLTQRETLRERTGSVKNVLIYFGGVDASNHTLEAIMALADTGCTGLQVNVVIGAQHPDRDRILSRCKELGYQCHVQTQAMARLMAEADLAVGAGGISAYERLYLRLPSILRPIAANQVEQLECMAAAGLCRLYDNREELTACLQQALAAPLPAPDDCVAAGNPVLAGYMQSQVSRQTASK